MDRMIRDFKVTQLAGAILFGLLLSPVFSIAQKAEKPAHNARMQQMETKNGNFTSFPVQHDNITGWAKFNKNAGHPEFGKMPYNAVYPGFVEVLEKRQVDERYFVNEKNPSEFHVQKGLGALHYKSNGQWVTIDHHLTDKGNGIFEADKQYDPVGFDVKKAASYIKTPEGEVYFNQWKLYGADNDGKEQLLAYANWSKYTAGEDGIYVTDIFPGIDAQMAVFRGSVKTDFIVRNLQFTNYKNLLFKDEFQSTATAGFKFAGYAASSNRAVAEVYLQSGKTNLLEIGQAIAYPQNGTKDQHISPEYILEGNTLVTSVPVVWIQQYVNKTNVIIDPLVTSANTLAQGSILGSMYNNNINCTFAGNSCNYNLNVNSPANATITDVQWSFDYIAQGACYREDGAVRFATGACLSPSQSGYYWFCNAASPGICSGANISVMSDLGSCMPAPSCSPQPITFTMQFFRDCFGATGCSNACIGANSPWTMTLIGHTIEFTNTGTPISVSSNNICFGQNISASTTSQYGVPAYSYNWSFNSSGTPSVGTGTNATISFPAPGTYTLYSIVTDACSQTTTANTVITVNAVPSITVTPSANPICQGQSTTLNASGATTYTWSSGGNGSSTSVSPGLGTTTYTVSGTASGCVGSNTVSVTVNPGPTLTVTANPANICGGQTSTLTASGATTYTWSTGTVASTETVSPGSTTTYTVTGDALGCQATQTVSVAVNPPPTLTVTASPATTCAGQTATLTASGATNYTWSSGGTNATETVTPSATTTYTVTGNSSGCISTETVTVNVNPLPSLTVTATPANICSGGTTTLTVSGATTYTWSANSGGGNGNPVVVSPTSNTTYTVAGTQGGCSDSTIISVNVGAQPVVSVSASDTSICSSQSTTLTASGATNYTWSSGGSGSTETVSPATTTTYTLIGDNGGCSDTTTFVVNVTATPTVTASAAPTAICSGQSSVLTAGGAHTYTWSSGGTASTETVTPNATTTYTVTGDSLGCTAMQVVTVSVTTTPTVTALTPTTSVCSGQSIPLIAGGATTYTWSANAGSVTTQTVIVTPVNNPETYTVTGANGNCIGTATVSVAVVTSPTVTLSSSASSLCAGGSDTLIATFNPAGSTVSWSPGGATTSTLVITPNTTGTWSCTVNNGGCTATQSIGVTVNPIPTVAAIASQTVCSGSNVNAINFSTSSNTTVNWTNTNTNIGLAASGSGTIAGYQSPAVTGQEIGVITATPADQSSGCTGSAQTFTITINPKPVVTGPALTDSALCGMPTGGVHNLSVSGGTPSYTYQWYMGITPVPNGSGVNLSNVPAGSYSLVVTDANSCVAFSGPYTVGGSPMVIASFSASPTSGTAPLNVTFINGSVGATTWNWNFANGQTSTAQNPSTTYENGGTYVVILTASNGNCTSTDTTTIVVDQAITLIVPNVFSPNGDNINDEFSFTASGITSLTCDIYNRWGQKIKTLSSPTDKWDGKLDNGHTASEGTYFYTVVASSFDDKPHNSSGYITIVK